MPTIAPVERDEEEVEVEEVVLADAAVAAALGASEEPGLDEPGGGGEMSKAGERLTLLELESSMILNLYCCVVGISDGIRTVALPLFVRVAGRRKTCQRFPEAQW
jgi:hypothetical protein